MTRRRVPSAATIGCAAAAVLMFAAAAVPALTHWQVYAGFPPLSGLWDPRVGAASLAALAIAVLSVAFGWAACERFTWTGLLLAAWLTGLGWSLSLALVDGLAGIDTILATPHEYLRTARATHNVSATLHEFISRIPAGSQGSWPVHVAGHPPGALLFFVLLVRLGLGSGLAAGLVVSVVASTTPVAVLVTLRVLGAEQAARRAAPFLVLSPAAIWATVSADGVFAAVAAWALAALALAAVRRSASWSLLAGLLFGCCLLLSYGLPLVGILAIAVLVATRTVFPVVPAIAAAGALILAFALAGFSLWAAYPVLDERYWAGIASWRPASYWLWGDLAALSFCAGPLMAAGLGQVFARARMMWPDSATRAVLTLPVAATAAIVMADVSLMSKAEVERIWLPFVPWLLVGCATLSKRWRQRGLVVQASTALLVQHLLFVIW
ncbi:MAG: hypothetical protein ACR2KG_02445 [Nocardioidaceae bacterium]